MVWQTGVTDSKSGVGHYGACSLEFGVPRRPRPFAQMRKVRRRHETAERASGLVGPPGRQDISLLQLQFRDFGTGLRAAPSERDPEIPLFSPRAVKGKFGILVGAA